MGVWQNNSIIRNQSLNFDAFRRLAFTLLEEVQNIGKNHWVLLQRSPEQLRDDVAGAIVAGWAKAACGDDQVGRGERLGNRITDRLRGVVYGDLATDEITVISELAAKPLLVRVEDATKH